MALEIATMLDKYWLEGKDTTMSLNVGLAGANSGLVNLISEVLDPCLNHIIDCPPCLSIPIYPMLQVPILLGPQVVVALVKF